MRSNCRATAPSSVVQRVSGGASERTARSVARRALGDCGCTCWVGGGEDVGDLWTGENTGLECADEVDASELLLLFAERIRYGYGLALDRTYDELGTVGDE